MDSVMKQVFALTVVMSAIWAIMGTAKQASPIKAPDLLASDVPVRNVPLLTFDRSKEIKIYLAFANISDKPLRYAYSRDAHFPVHRLAFHLLRSNRVVSAAMKGPRVGLTFLTAEDMKTLRPGEMLLNTLDIGEDYNKNLLPGTHELRACYTITPFDPSVKEFGATSMRLAFRTMCYFEIN